MTLATMPALGELNGERVGLVTELMSTYAKKLPGNKKKLLYYEQKNLFQDFRISTPPQLQGIESTLGWASKPVDVLAERIRAEKFVSPDGDENPFGLNDIAADNDFASEFSQGTTSALISSLVFATVSAGLDGEPEQLWSFHPAEDAAGIWDRRRRGLIAGLLVLDREDGSPSRLALYFPGEVVEATLSGGRWRLSAPVRTPAGRMLMERVAFKPTLRRPMGQSRITRTVRYLSDAAVRTMVRSEVGGEFFAAPQRYGLGIDGEDLDRWKAVTGRLWTITRDEEGELPQLGQFPQHSMQPHTDHMRMWANLLSGESSIPVSELGFVSDNPSSDSAIQSQRDPMRLAADSFIRDAQAPIRSLATTSVMVRDGLSEPPEGMRHVTMKFAPTVHSTDAAAADAVLKQIQALPWMADSAVVIEKLGYSKEDVERLMSDKRRGQAGSTLDRVLAGAPQAPEAVTPDDDAR